MANTKKWTTKTGEKIRIKDMSDSHLMNAIRMIERIAATTIIECPCDGDKDWCFCHADGQSPAPSDVSPQYDDLVKEAARRKLIDRKSADEKLYLEADPF